MVTTGKGDTRWDRLSMSQRGELIGIYVRNGIYDLGTMKEHYNSFGEGGELDELIKSEDPNLNFADYIDGTKSDKTRFRCKSKSWNYN